MSYISWNGTLMREEQFRIGVNNQTLRYGDGFFETIKVKEGKLLLNNLHFHRLFSSLEILQFEVPLLLTPDFLHSHILRLLEKNEHQHSAKVRIMICREESENVQMKPPQILIQSWIWQEPENVHPLHIGIYYDARKSIDRFSPLKSNNYLSYILAARFAKQHKLDDAIVLNTHGRVADSSISNVFIVRNNIIYTPPLSEGCIDGVYRKFLLQDFKKNNISFSEEPITVEALMQADELFLTNALRGIRPVQSLGEKTYATKYTDVLKERYV